MLNQLPIDVKKSKTEHPIPIVNGIHLHSAYNPHREAEGFAKKYTDTIEENNNILVFGLGFAYHINQLAHYLRKTHKRYEIFVIEPNTNIVSECRNRDLLDQDSSITVVSYDDIDQFFTDEKLINFMVKKPAVIPLPSSFRLHEEFFKLFMSYKASNDISVINKLVKSDSLALALATYKDEKLNHVLDKLTTVNRLNSDEELFLLAYKEIITTNSTGALHE